MQMESTRALAPRKVPPYGYVNSTLSCFCSLPVSSRLTVCYILVSRVFGLAVDGSGHKSKSFKKKAFERQQTCHHRAFICCCYFYLNIFEGQNCDCSNLPKLPKAFALNPMFQSMEWEDWISLDAWEDSDPRNLTPSPSLEFSAPVNKPQGFHQFGQFIFDDDQLRYLLVNSTLAGGRNSILEVATVLRYKWPSQFHRLSDSDLETMLSNVNSHGEVTQ